MDWLLNQGATRQSQASFPPYKSDSDIVGGGRPASVATFDSQVAKAGLVEHQEDLLGEIEALLQAVGSSSPRRLSVEHLARRQFFGLGDEGNSAAMRIDG